MSAAEPTAWHALTTDEAAGRLKSSVKAGLDEAEAARRQAEYGLNLLPTARKRGPLMRFLQQFNNVLVYVLIAAGFIKLMMSLWLDASIILAVVIINGLLGFIQEGRAEKSLDSIRNMLSPEARTLRNGQTAMIAAEKLVPGDIVFLESGDKIPADLRLVEVKNLRTEEAALTGESVPSDKSTEPVSANATVGDRAGMAYSGTLVVSGRATGLVVATGADTELGRINQMLAGVSSLETPLLLQIKKFGYAITVIILIISAITFVYGRFVQHIPFVEMFQAVTGIAVSMIPEGLPALITITLAIGVQRMAAAQRDRPASASGRNAGLRGAHLLRQDRHADAHGNDGRFGRDRRRRDHGHRRRLRQRRRGAQGRRARRRRSGAPAPRACLGFLQRFRAAPGGRRHGRWRAIRPRARSIRSPPNSASSGRRSRPLIRASTSSPSNPNTSSWRPCTRRPMARCFSSRARPR